MAGRGARGKEVALQVEIESQEDWEEAVAKEGLTVVDVYQEWCGPCKAMQSTFKRIKNETGDDLLHFAIAKADSIESLERYRGKCEPCFLFYATGVLVDVVRGANAPVLARVIAGQLTQEHKVLEGAAERKEIHDPKFPHGDTRKSVGGTAAADDSDSSDSEDEEGDDETRASDMFMGGERINYLGLPEAAPSGTSVMLERMVTVAIIEPDVVAAGVVDEVLEKLKTVGIEILEQTERQLTVDEVKEFFASRSGEEKFDDMCTYMSSGPCQILILTKGDFGEGIVEEWQEIMGPESIEEAKKNSPDSLRALYGKADNPVSKAFYGSRSIKDAKRELRFFFADFVVPKVSLTHFKPIQQQRTLAIIRPDALREHKDTLLQLIVSSGFKIAMQNEMELSREQAENFYRDEASETYYEELVTRMSSGPLLALVLEKQDAVESWRELLGPKEVDVAQIEAPDSLRAKFAIPDVAINQLHGSDTDEKALQEIAFFFPLQHTVAVIKPDVFHTKEMLTLKIREAGFNVVAQKDVHLTKEMAMDLYKNCKDKEYFNDLIEFMTSGPTSYLILSRNAAVAGWKDFIGPTDPESAKLSNPSSFRALYGTSILTNAVHGASDADSAREEIKIIFGEVEFDSEGNLKRRKKKKVVEDEPICVESESSESAEEEEIEEEDVEPEDADMPAKIPLGDSQSEDVLAEPVDYITPRDVIDPWKRFILKSEARIHQSSQKDKAFWRQFRLDLLTGEGEVEVDVFEGLAEEEIWMVWNSLPPLSSACDKEFDGWLGWPSVPVVVAGRTVRAFNGWLEWNVSKELDPDVIDAEREKDARELDERVDVEEFTPDASSAKTWTQYQETLNADDHNDEELIPFDGWFEWEIAAESPEPPEVNSAEQLDVADSLVEMPPADSQSEDVLAEPSRRQANAEIWNQYNIDLSQPSVEQLQLDLTPAASSHKVVSDFVANNESEALWLEEQHKPYTRADEDAYYGWLLFPTDNVAGRLEELKFSPDKDSLSVWNQFNEEVLEYHPDSGPAEFQGWQAGSSAGLQVMSDERVVSQAEFEPMVKDQSLWMQQQLAPAPLERDEHYEGWMAVKPALDAVSAASAMPAAAGVSMPCQLEEPQPAFDGWLKWGGQSAIAEEILRAEAERDSNSGKEQNLVEITHEGDPVWNQHQQEAPKSKEADSAFEGWNGWNVSMEMSQTAIRVEQDLDNRQTVIDELAEVAEIASTPAWVKFNEPCVSTAAAPVQHPAAEVIDHKQVDAEDVPAVVSIASMPCQLEESQPAFDGWLKWGGQSAIAEEILRAEAERDSNSGKEQNLVEITHEGDPVWNQHQQEAPKSKEADSAFEGWNGWNVSMEMSQTAIRVEQDLDNRQTVIDELAEVAEIASTPAWVKFNEPCVSTAAAPVQHPAAEPNVRLQVDAADVLDEEQNVVWNQQQQEAPKHKETDTAFEGWSEWNVSTEMSQTAITVEQALDSKKSDAELSEQNVSDESNTLWEKFNSTAAQDEHNVLASSDQTTDPASQKEEKKESPVPEADAAAEHQDAAAEHGDAAAEHQDAAAEHGDAAAEEGGAVESEVAQTAQESVESEKVGEDQAGNDEMKAEDEAKPAEEETSNTEAVADVVHEREAEAAAQPEVHEDDTNEEKKEAEAEQQTHEVHEGHEGAKEEIHENEQAHEAEADNKSQHAHDDKEGEGGEKPVAESPHTE